MSEELIASEPLPPPRHSDSIRKPSRRIERVYLSPTPSRALWLYGFGLLATATLGAGSYERFFTEDPRGIALYLLFGGALALGLVILTFPNLPGAMLVGDGGIGMERSGDSPLRVAWCDLRRLSFDKVALIAEGGGVTIRIPLSSPAAAVALQEARERVPKIVPNELPGGLLAANPQAGTERSLKDLQVAGKRCKASGQIISFERDARVCFRCGETYHKDHMPERCLTCGS